MAVEQGLYAQVVVLFRKDLEFTEGNQNQNEAKFMFQGRSARSQSWFDLYFDWIEVNFSTREPDFYGNSLGYMTIYKIQIHLKRFKFQ